MPGAARWRLAYTDHFSLSKEKKLVIAAGIAFREKIEVLVARLDVISAA
jgi:hypothetical protein